MTDYRIKNLETGQLYPAARAAGLARNMFIEQRKKELEASNTSGKKVNVLKLTAGSKYALVEWDVVRGLVKTIETYGATASWYTPVIARGTSEREYDGTYADWKSGKFHK